MALAEVSDQDFQTKVLDSKRPILVDFWASWCGPCRMAAPVLEELAGTHKGKVDIVKLDVDKNTSSPQKYNVMSIPTTILFRVGQEVGRQVGFAGKQKFVDLLEKV